MEVYKNRIVCSKDWGYLLGAFSFSGERPQCSFMSFVCGCIFTFILSLLFGQRVSHVLSRLSFHVRLRGVPLTQEPGASRLWSHFCSITSLPSHGVFIAAGVPRGAWRRMEGQDGQGGPHRAPLSCPSGWEGARGASLSAERRAELHTVQLSHPAPQSPGCCQSGWEATAGESSRGDLAEGAGLALDPFPGPQ